MRPATLSLALALGLSPAALRADEPIPVPSGQTVTWIDTISDAQGPEGLTARFRFLAPAIAREGGTVSLEAAHADMAFLCDTWVIPRLSGIGPQPVQVVVSLSDRPVPFGEADPEATQFFEAYRPEDGLCVPEPY